MAIPPIPTGFYVSQGNGQAFAAANEAAGALTYTVQRSIDGVNFSTVASGLALPQFLDTTVSIGTQYWYQIAGVNGSGTSQYTNPMSVVPAEQGEMSLGELRMRAKQRADKVNSNFVPTEEWNFFINQALFELYDLLKTAFEEYFLAPAATFVTDGNNYLYPLPDGKTTFLDINGNPFIPVPLYALQGVDLAVNNSDNAYVTIKKFNFIDRNRFIYPNTNSTIYGVFNLRYRMMGNSIYFIPTPSSGQTIRLWYTPRMNTLLEDQDITVVGYSGWLQYAIVRAAKYALDKENSPTDSVDSEILFLKTRIEQTAADRDEGQPDTVSDVRTADPYGMGSFGGTFRAGF